VNVHDLIARALAQPVLDLADFEGEDFFKEHYDPEVLARSAVDRPITIEDVKRARETLDIIERVLEGGS